MRLRILYFAAIREAAGVEEEHAAPPPEVKTVGALMGWLVARRPTLARAFAAEETLCIACNQEYARRDTLLAGAEEIAFFPPVTGG